MFTGIVQSKAKVLSAKISNGICRLVIEVESSVAQQLTLGASIAINGTCLTVVSFEALPENTTEIHFDVIDESLRVTNLCYLKSGDYVNFERSLKVGDEIGGHQVSGHVHCQAKVVSIVKNQDNCEINFKLTDHNNRFLFEKGFIAINGVSLTIGQVNDCQFNVYLIPETLLRTNIGTLVEGNLVNIEFDQQTITIVNTIERMNLQLK
ncbi:riboflavin synthase subunit alpha [Colwellia sp. MEBiC06753]